MLSKKKRIYVYGKGSSGLAAMEMKFRFMRIGANIEAITDEHIMKMNSVLLDGDCAVIGISVSGKTEAVLESMKIAKKCGAKVILMTAHTGKKFLEFCDEIMLFALKENLEQGKAISPQFPILIMVYRDPQMSYPGTHRMPTLPLRHRSGILRPWKRSSLAQTLS